jgi:DNA polymerase III alpha subunit
MRRDEVSDTSSCGEGHASRRGLRTATPTGAFSRSQANSADTRGFAPPDFGPEDRLRYEWELMGMWLTMHPTETDAARKAASGTVRTVDLRRFAGRSVSLLGVPIARRGVRTKRGETMMFLTIEDAHGVAECTLFPPAYRRFRAAARSEELIRVSGKVEDQYGAVTLTASSVEAFPFLR